MNSAKQKSKIAFNQQAPTYDCDIKGQHARTLYPVITPELEHRKSGYVERKRRPYQGNVVRIA